MFVYGERLRVDVEAPPTGGGTHYEPQTADQARDLLLPRLQAVVAQVAELPEEYKGERLYVETQLLPNYLAPVVRRIYEEYLRGLRGTREIRDLLNSDPERFPPRDAPDPTKASGHWSTSSVWEVLHNPKYTGYQVWNRRRRKKDNGTNPESEWIWSEEPSHPAVVSMEEWRAVQGRAAANERVRRTPLEPTSAPDAGRTEYLFRGLVRCGSCGLRMWGGRPASRYYRCQPSHQRTKGIPADPPPMVHLGERPLLEAVSEWLTAAVFGPERLDYWREALAASAAPRPSSSARDRVGEIVAEIGDIERRIERQVLALEDDDAPPGLRRRVAERVAQLEAAADDRRATLARLRVEAAADEPTFDDVEAVLASMPVSGSDLRSLPQPELRMLFDSLNLAVTFHHETRKADIQVTLWRGQPNGADADTTDRPPPGRIREEVWIAPSVGFEPTHPPPEGGALSPELRGPFPSMLSPSRWPAAPR